jgi:hypothetical protein
MKFRKHISGMKNPLTGKGYVSGYDARIPAEIIAAAGFVGKDGETLEYEVIAEDGKIVLKKIATK